MDKQPRVIKLDRRSLAEKMQLPARRFYPLLMQGQRWALEVETLQSSFAFRVCAAAKVGSSGVTIREILLPKDSKPERIDEFLLELGEMLTSLLQKGK